VKLKEAVKQEERKSDLSTTVNRCTTTGFIGGYNLGAQYATEWRDTHLRLRDPAAAELARAFIGFWNRFSSPHEQITQQYHHPFDALISISQNEAMRASFPIRDMYIAAIDEAEHSILLTTAYFVPDHMLIDALKAAVKRGVDVLDIWR
jgi:cardiolipin synthase A/B